MPIIEPILCLERTRTMKNAIRSTKNFVVKRRAPLAFVAGAVASAIVVTKINQAGFDMHNNFLRENGLYEAFYDLAPTE